MGDPPFPDETTVPTYVALNLHMFLHVLELNPIQLDVPNSNLITHITVYTTQHPTTTIANFPNLSVVVFRCLLLVVVKGAGQ